MTEEKRRVPAPIDERRFAFAQDKRQDFTVNAEDGTLVEDLLAPAYWANLGARLQPFDRIDVRHEYGLWLVELLVLSNGKNWAKVKVLHKYELEAVDQEEGQKSTLHVVEHKGAQHQWSVKRLSDSNLVQTGFKTKDLAVAWLKNHEAVTA